MKLTVLLITFLLGLSLSSFAQTGTVPDVINGEQVPKTQGATATSKGYKVEGACDCNLDGGPLVKVNPNRYDNLLAETEAASGKKEGSASGVDGEP